MTWARPVTIKSNRAKFHSCPSVDRFFPTCCEACSAITTKAAKREKRMPAVLFFHEPYELQYQTAMQDVPPGTMVGTTVMEITNHFLIPRIPTGGNM